MKEEKKAVEKKAEPRGAELTRETTTLKIWDVPMDLARTFIGISKSRYANKSHLFLRDVMEKAARYDDFIMSGRLTEIEERLTAVEKKKVKDEEEEKKGEKIPKTFGE